MRIAKVFQYVFPLCLAAALSACASGYSQFYTPVAGSTPERLAAIRVAPPTGNPVVEHASPPGSNGAALVDAYIKRGYVVIGASSFNSSTAQSDAAAIEQARRVGADLVLIFSPRYTGSTTSAVPFVTPTSSTSYTTANATVNSPYGTSTGYGNATTTTYGSTTTMIPITINHNDYGAAYFIKRKFSFGAFYRDLTDSERQQIQSNKGVYIRAIVDNSPAYEADILPGDIIISIEHNDVGNAKSTTALIQQYSGRQVTISLYRNGNRIDKSLYLQ